jgi:hypothetical protein
MLIQAASFTDGLRWLAPINTTGLHLSPTS